MPISTIANSSLSVYYESPPTGSVTLGGVPFYISPQGSNVLFTEDSGYGLGGPTTGVLSGNLGNAKTAYVLIDGTDVSVAYNNCIMGYINVTYANATVNSFALTVGYNIRDWVIAAGKVGTTTGPNVSAVWTGTSQAPWLYEPASIDMLTLSLNTSSPVTEITILDESRQLLNNASPGLFVSAITLDTVPEPSTTPALLCGIAGLGGTIMRGRNTRRKNNQSE